MPKRIQRPWIWRDRPPDVIDVTRATRFGNPFTEGDRTTLVARYRQWVTDPDAPPIRGRGGSILLRESPAAQKRNAHHAKVVRAYGAPVDGKRRTFRPPTGEDIALLRGKDLACFCPLDGGPCHADVLLELANPTTNERESA